MRAWTVDADDIQVAEDFNESLLHRTPMTMNLSSRSEHRKPSISGIDAAVALMMALGRAMIEDEQAKGVEGFLSSPIFG